MLFCMLWQIFPWAITPDLSYCISNEELSQLGRGEWVYGTLLSPNWSQMIIWKTSLIVSEKVMCVTWNPANINLDISIPAKLFTELSDNWRLHSWIDSMGMGSKISIATLWILEWEMWIWSLLMTAWFYIAHEKGLLQSEEQWLVEWLFSGITDKEREIVFDILNP